uniref:Uncharacterized protein n=4 Tax=Nothobranchius TaxID=28779 RepID=A0A1A8RD37_9TELE
MASGSSLLSEEEFLCPICLETFNKPVSTPCGHNFCMSCITSYWDNAAKCWCPVCKETFTRKPNLKVNTFISGLVSQFRSLHVTNGSFQGSGSVVQCDFCIDPRNAATKSCLECLSSYCNDHLESHYTDSALRRHTLVGPVANLVDNVCKEHHKLLKLFCRDDGVVLCDICVSSHHTNHDVVPVQWGYNNMQDMLGELEIKVQRKIQERLQKVQNMRTSVEKSKREAQEVMAKGTQDLSELVFEMEKIQLELVRVVEEKRKTAEEEAEGLINRLEREISDLKETATKLEKLKQSKDLPSFLQSYQNQPLLPPTMDLSGFVFTKHLEIQHTHTSLRRSISQLRTLVSQMNKEINRFSSCPDASNEVMLQYMQQHEVNIVLDPETAHPLLSVSADGKRVWYNSGTGLWGNQILRPNTFTVHLAALGQRGFSSCKFYFEVFVGQKTEWCLGVATASIQKNGAMVRDSGCGLWSIWFLMDKFETFSSPGVSVHAGKVEKVGVFVDWDGGEISFFDVVKATPIYSFTECLFSEELYPYFNPCDNEYGSNLGPMIIVPVSSVE